MADAAATPQFSTIYDALGAWRAEFFPGEKPLDSNKAQLYHAISELCAGFAIADLRHDFTDELNINIFIDATSRQSIGLFQIRQICGAYYALNSSHFKDLYAKVRDAYLGRMTSDTAAKAYVERQTVKFFSAVFPALREDPLREYRFKNTSYTKLLENSHSLTGVPYETPAEKDAILAKLKPAERPILLDAQMGNPNQQLFSYYSHKNNGSIRATYLYNFATVLDAAEKLTADVHLYMNVYMQNIQAPKDISIPPHIGAYMHTNIISAPYYQTKIKDWEVISKFIFGGGGTYQRNFSSTDRASVNVLGLIPTRGKKANAETKAAAREALNLKFVNPMHVSVNHQFKSTGDRYQVYSASASFPEKSIDGFYKFHGNLQVATVPPERQINLPLSLAVRPIIITNDILNKYQCYFFQVDTLFTEAKALTFIDYAQGEIISTKGVRDSITAEIVSKIYTVIRRDLIVNIDISSPNSFLTSLYNAASARRLTVMCENVPFLEKFLGDTPPKPEELRAMVTDTNASVFYSYLMGDISQNLRSSVDWTERQNSMFVYEIGRYIAENSEGVHSLSKAVQYVKLFNAIMCHIEAIQYYLSNMLIENHIDILAHLILLMFGGRGIVDTYKNVHLLMTTLLNPRRGTVLSCALNDACDLHNYSKEQAIKDLEPIIAIIDGYEPTAVPSYLGELKNVLRVCQLEAAKKGDFLPVYAALDPIILSALLFKMMRRIISIPGAQKALLREVLASNDFVVGDDVEMDEEMAAAPVPRPLLVHPLKYTRRAKSDTAKPGIPKNTKTRRAAQLQREARTKILEEKRKAKMSTDAYDALTMLSERTTEPTPDDQVIGITAAEGEQYMIRDSDHLNTSALETHTVFTRMKSFIRHVPAAISRKAQDIYGVIRALFARLDGVPSSGGTRTRSSRSNSTSPISRASLYDLCEQKLELMCMMIGQPRMAFAGMHLFASFNQLNLIRQNMLAVKRRSRTITLSVPTKPTIRGGGGELSNASTITAPIYLEEEASTRSISMKRPKALELIHKQLLSFFFAGFTRDHNAVATEKQILGQYLPVIVRDEISSTHNQLFWHPLFNRVTASYDEFAALYGKILRQLVSVSTTKKTRYIYGKTIRSKHSKSRPTRKTSTQ